MGSCQGFDLVVDEMRGAGLSYLEIGDFLAAQFWVPDWTAEPASDRLHECLHAHIALTLALLEEMEMRDRAELFFKHYL